MERFLNDEDALDFVASQISDEALHNGVALSEVERKMLYFSESAWTLPDILDVNAAFDRDYDQEIYEKKISQLIRTLAHRLRKEQPEHFKVWSEAIKRLSKEDRYFLVMVEQAGQGRTFRQDRTARSLGGISRLWVTGIAVAVVWAGLVMLVHKVFPSRNMPVGPRGNPSDLGFAAWVATICIIALYSLLRWILGARTLDDATARALEWVFGQSRRTR